MFQQFVQKLKASINVVPHWMLIVLAAGVGAAITYLKQEGPATVWQDLQTWATAKVLLQGAVMAAVGMMVGLLRKEPWLGISGSASGGGPVSLNSTDLKTVPPKPPVPPSAARMRRRAWRIVPAIGLASLLLVVACAQLPMIVSDVTNIANIVWSDVQKGETAEQVIADVLTQTGSEDVSLVVSIVSTMLADPQLPVRNPEMVAPLQQVLAVAQVKLAAQKAQRAVDAVSHVVSMVSR